MNIFELDNCSGIKPRRSEKVTYTLQIEIMSAFNVDQRDGIDS